MSLSQQIKQYYFDQIEELPQAKQFHFASRLAAWQNDPKAVGVLNGLWRYMAPTETPEGFVELYCELLNSPPRGRRNAHELRQPYFEKYPKLWGAHLALFRARHLRFVYGIESSEELFRAISRRELDDMATALLNDENALRFLSTFAVNFLYLYKQILLGLRDYIDPRRFVTVADGYDLNDKRQLQLLIYLFTHCIIGESNFYAQGISHPNLPVYREMLKTLEAVISDNFKLINLDNKLEFSVCCRICGYDSRLSEPISREASGSLDSSRRFIVDPLNRDKPALNSFAGSEHRNVLYIMSQSAYRYRPALSE